MNSFNEKEKYLIKVAENFLKLVCAAVKILKCWWRLSSVWNCLEVKTITSEKLASIDDVMNWLTIDTNVASLTWPSEQPNMQITKNVRIGKNIFAFEQSTCFWFYKFQSQPHETIFFQFLIIFSNTFFFASFLSVVEYNKTKCSEMVLTFSAFVFYNGYFFSFRHYYWNIFNLAWDRKRLFKIVMYLWYKCV